MTSVNGNEYSNVDTLEESELSLSKKKQLPRNTITLEQMRDILQTNVTQGEAAEILGINVSTVKRVFSKYKEELRMVRWPKVVSKKSMGGSKSSSSKSPQGTSPLLPSPSTILNQGSYRKGKKAVHREENISVPKSNVASPNPLSNFITPPPQQHDMMYGAAKASFSIPPNSIHNAPTPTSYAANMSYSPSTPQSFSPSNPPTVARSMEANLGRKRPSSQPKNQPPLQKPRAANSQSDSDTARPDSDEKSDSTQMSREELIIELRRQKTINSQLQARLRAYHMKQERAFKLSTELSRCLESSYQVKGFL